MAAVYFGHRACCAYVSRDIGPAAAYFGTDELTTFGDPAILAWSQHHHPRF
jgi:hypothetical protein